MQFAHKAMSALQGPIQAKRYLSGLRPGLRPSGDLLGLRFTLKPPLINLYN